MKQLPIRQIHLDFHTSPDIPDIGAAFDQETFIKTLQDAHVESINLFAKCHHGMSYYPTKVGKMHPNLQFDLLGAQIAACREAGIRTAIYTCVAWNELTSAEHPEWRTVDAETGFSGNKHPFDDSYYGWNALCLNHRAYRELLKAELEELYQRYHPDGFWLDLVRNFGCICPACLERMEQLGLDPTSRADRNRHNRLSEIQFMKEFYEYLHAMDKDLTVFFNSLPYSLDDGSEPEYSSHLKRNYYSFYDIESVPSETWGYTHFPVAVNYINKYDRDICMMNGKFHMAWGDFGTLRNEKALEYELFRAVANGTCVCVGDQMHPTGALEPAVYQRIGKVYQSLQEKEPWLRNTKKVAEVAVLIEQKVCDTVDPQAPSLIQEGVCRILTELHYPFDFVDITDDLSPYRLLILPDSVSLTEEMAGKIHAFTERGGKVLATGYSGFDADGRSMLQGMAMRLLGQSKDDTRYIRCDREIFAEIPPMDHSLYERGATVRAEGRILAEIVSPYFNRSYRHFCGHRQTPPKPAAEGEPAIVQYPCGIYSSALLFTDYAKHGYKVYKDILGACIQRLMPEPLLHTDLPASTEVTLRKQPESYVLHLLNYMISRKCRTLDLIEEETTVCGKYMALRMERPPRSVCKVPEGAPVAWKYEAGYLFISIAQAHGHTMYEVKL